MTSAETTAEDEAGRSELSRNWAAVFLAIGLASGFAVYFILEYAASDPWEIGPSLGLLTSAAAFCLAVEPRRWWPAAAAGLAGIEGAYDTVRMRDEKSPFQIFMERLAAESASLFGKNEPELFGRVEAPYQQPALKQIVSSVLQEAEFYEGFNDPNNLYVRCLECELP